MEKNTLPEISGRINNNTFLQAGKKKKKGKKERWAHAIQKIINICYFFQCLLLVKVHCGILFVCCFGLLFYTAIMIFASYNSKTSKTSMELLSLGLLNECGFLVSSLEIIFVKCFIMPVDYESKMDTDWIVTLRNYLKLKL